VRCLPAHCTDIFRASVLDHIIRAIKPRKMDGACSMQGRGEKYITKFWSEDLGIDGKIVLEWIFLK
jgi:hypothetical protein